MRVFCTTKIYQMVKISFSSSKRKRANTVGSHSSGKKSFFRTMKSNESNDGKLYLSYKIESELSGSIDFDEIKMGDLLAKGGYGTVYKALWRDAEVAVKMLNVQDLVDSEQEMVRREIKLMG